jgi:signal peptidase complex subunit 2
MPRSTKAAVANHASPSPPLSSRSSPDGDRPAGPLSITTDLQQREEVKVNNANLTELKNACDDALKRVRRLICLSFAAT